MTKKELEQYRSVVAEIRETEEQIKENTVTDTVSGSDAEFPYTKHSMSVAGLEKNEYNNTLMARRNKLQRQRRKVERYVDGIEDSLTRRIFRMRYIEGDTCPTWAQITRKIYPRLAIDRLERMKWSIEKKHDRYFRKEKPPIL